MEKEIWKSIVGYEGKYQISSYGRVKSLVRKGMRHCRILKFSLSHNGYRQLGLWKNCIRKNFRVSRLVAIAFISNPDNKPEVNHKSGIKIEDRVENLEWCTRKENCGHRDVVLGKHNKGERHNLAKLKEEDILFIRNCRLTQKEICGRYNLSQQHVSAILNRVRWDHI